MSFLDHLEELRWHLVRSMIAVGVGMVAVFIYLDDFIHYVVLAPLRSDFPTHRILCKLNRDFCFDKLDVSYQATSPSEQFTRAILLAAVGGLIAAFPYVVWEMWRFIKPGLYAQEVKRTRGSVAIVSILFLIGVSFTYYSVLPFTFRFFADFRLDPSVQNIWRIGDVIGLVVQFCLAGGVLFELPVIVYVLSSLGILTPMLMRRYRKHATVGTLVLAGILTPSPDVLSQLLLAGPMFLLYEISIYISNRVYQRRQRAMTPPAEGS